MSGKVFASFNLKGGVGKTAAAVNLAYAAAASGRRVLLWDLDPQAAACYYYRVKPGIKGGGKKMIRKPATLQDFIKETDYAGLDLMPADFSYRNLDLYLARKKKWAGRLTQLIAPLRNDYDIVMLDCPPGASLVSENVFAASDALLLPLIPTFLSLRVYERLQTYFAGHPEHQPLLLPFFAMVDRRRTLHREIVESFLKDQTGCLKTSIAYSTVVEQMGRFRAPVQVFAGNSEAAVSYDTLWQEIDDRVSAVRHRELRPN